MANVKLRQELNILDHLLVAATGATATSKEIVQLDTTQYNGATYYFEIVAYSDTSLAFDVTLTGATDGAVKVISVPTLTTVPTIFRSTSFTPTTATQNMTVVISAAVGTNKNVKSARIVIIQSAATLTNTETQIEIGNYNLARTAETATILVNPKYWKYTAANWDGTKTFYAEAVYDSGDMDTITVDIREAPDITAPVWTSVATIVFAATTTVPTRTRVAFTPVDGRWYTIFSLNGSMDNHDIYNAKVIIDQGLDTVSTYIFNSSNGAASDPNAVWANDANAYDTDNLTTPTTVATSATAGSASSNYIQGFGTDAPTSGNTIKLVEARFYHKANGGLSATSIQIFTQSLGQSLGTQTNISDLASNSWSTYFSLSIPSGGWTWSKVSLLECKAWIDNIVGGTAGIYAVEVRVTYQSGSADFTKLEPQYLLANTLFAAGTALQTFLTKWDSTEWNDSQDGQPTFYFQAEAANGSTSDVTLEQADGGGTVTNSTLTNIDNAQISAAMTMPASENLDTKATTNSGDVAAARILVKYVVNVAAAVAPTEYVITRRGGGATLVGPSIYGFIGFIGSIISKIWTN